MRSIGGFSLVGFAEMDTDLRKGMYYSKVKAKLWFLGLLGVGSFCIKSLLSFSKVSFIREAFVVSCPSLDFN